MNWNEVIRKENKSSQIYDKFDINPHNLYIITDKPNKIVKDPAEDEKKKKDAKTEEVEEKLRTKITESKLTPQMKYKHPVTASQEIGWVGSEVKSFDSETEQAFSELQLELMSRNHVRIKLLRHERLWTVQQQEQCRFLKRRRQREISSKNEIISNQII